MREDNVMTEAEGTRLTIEAESEKFQHAVLLVLKMEERVINQKR